MTNIIDYYGKIHSTNDWMCSCCGARVGRISENTKYIHPGRGIRVWVGKHGVARTAGENKLEHIQTKNGILTITTSSPDNKS